MIQVVSTGERKKLDVLGFAGSIRAIMNWPQKACKITVLAMAIAILLFSGTSPVFAQTTGAALSRPHKVIVSGNYAYVASQDDNALEIIDISNPKLPRHASLIASIGGHDGVIVTAPLSVAVAGNYAYVPSPPINSLSIINISDPANPVFEKVLNHNDDVGFDLRRPTLANVFGDYLFLITADNTTVSILDISDPLNPVLAGQYFTNSLSGFTSVFVDGNYMYLTVRFLGHQGGVLQILDISDPANIIFRGGLNHGDGGASLNIPTSVFVSGNYAYVASPVDHALEVIDISNPDSAVHAGKIASQTEMFNPAFVKIYGNYAFVTASSEIQVIDITDPSNPTFIGDFPYNDTGNGSSPVSIDFSGDYAYVVLNGTNALDVLDISDVTNITRVGRIKDGELVGEQQPCTTDCFSNVLFLPGFEASRLYSKEGGSENQLWEPNRNLDVEKLYLDASGNSIDSSIYTRDIIDTGQGIKDIYKSFTERMGSLMDEGKINVWKPYAYDWRENVEDIVNNGTSYENGKVSLISTLEELVESSKSGKVTIVAHSNGGLLAKALLKKVQEDKNNGISDLIDKVDVLILVGVPHIGTAKAIPGIIHGYAQELAFGLFMDSAHARELGRNMPAAYGFLPSREYINRVSASPVTFKDTVIPSGVSTNLVQAFGSALDSYDEYKNYLFGAEGRANPSVSQTSLPISLSPGLFTEAENLHDNIDSWTPPTSLRVIEIAGWGLETLASFEYYPKRFCVGGNVCDLFLDQEPRFTIDGDGTVIVPSAHYMSVLNSAEKYWLNLPLNNKGLNKNRKHSNILEVDSILDLISNIVQKSNSFDTTYLSTSVPSDSSNRLRLSIQSPVTLDAFDADGNHTGKVCSASSDFCVLEEEIPNSSYLEFGEGKYLNLPEEKAKSIKLQGTDIGTFTYKSERILPDATSTTHSFVDIPVTTQTQAEVILNQVGTPQLKLDVTGDGTSDFTLSPSENFDPIVYLRIMQATINSLDLPNAKKQAFNQRVENIIKAINNGKINKAQLRADKFKSALEKRLAKPDPRKPKPRKISKTDAQLLLDMLNKLLDNIS